MYNRSPLCSLIISLCLFCPTTYASQPSIPEPQEGGKWHLVGKKSRSSVKTYPSTPARFYVAPNRGFHSPRGNYQGENQPTRNHCGSCRGGRRGIHKGRPLGQHSKKRLTLNTKRKNCALLITDTEKNPLANSPIESLCQKNSIQKTAQETSIKEDWGNSLREFRKEAKAHIERLIDEDDNNEFIPAKTTAPQDDRGLIRALVDTIVWNIAWRDYKLNDQ